MAFPRSGDLGLKNDGYHIEEYKECSVLHSRGRLYNSISFRTV